MTGLRHADDRVNVVDVVGDPLQVEALAVRLAPAAKVQGLSVPALHAADAGERDRWITERRQFWERQYDLLTLLVDELKPHYARISQALRPSLTATLIRIGCAMPWRLQTCSMNPTARELPRDDAAVEHPRPVVFSRDVKRRKIVNRRDARTRRRPDHAAVTRDVQHIELMLAREAGLSERSLQRLVEQRIGLSPKWLLQRRRLADHCDP